MSTAVLETEWAALRKLLSRLSRAEKAQILQWIVQDLGDAFPGIERVPNGEGVTAFVVRTRIPVWLLEQTRRLGATDADLLQAYPTLRAADLTNAWAYVRVHGTENNEAIAANDAD